MGTVRGEGEIRMARRAAYFLLNKKEDFERGSGDSIAVDGRGIVLIQGRREGVYDTRVFDCLEKETEWQRLLLDGTALQNVSVSVYAADEESRVRTECAKVMNVRNPGDILLYGVRGRYLRLRLTFRRQEEEEIRISRIKICFPRQTWLSYLPEIYRESAEHDSFLGRYLGIFQTIYEEMTEQIAQIPRRLSAFYESDEALRELSEWLGIENGELWNQEQRRYLIRNAVRLSHIRGTAEYLRELICLATGKRVYVVEYCCLMPYFDGGETERRLKELYASNPYEFAVLVDGKEQAVQEELCLIGRIVEMAKPAYMECRIIAPPPYLFLGRHTYLGINSVLGRYRELRLDGTCAMPFIQLRICAEASQIPLIAEQNLRFCSRSSAKSASEWEEK